MPYHIHAVAEVKAGIFGEVADSEAQCFGLYEVRQAAQGRVLEWVSDHPTRADAEQAMLALQKRA
ncbi:hypothetical protein [Desulfovibrio desulfuricans]|uniref:hypothetical protein n=1 Tax=Desulfovibrio desulfuricans TaxID=876 RepID=UPI0039841E6C